MDLASGKQPPSLLGSSLLRTDATLVANASARRSQVASRPTDVGRLEEDVLREAASQRGLEWCLKDSVATSRTVSATPRIVSKHLIAWRPRDDVCLRASQFQKDSLFCLVGVDPCVSVYTFL